MSGLLKAARTRLGWAVIGAAATLALGGVATAAVVSSPGTRPTSDTSAVTTPADSPAATSTASATQAASSTPVSAPEVSSPAATVAAVDTQPAAAATTTQAAEPTPTPDPQPTTPPVNIGGQLPTDASMPPLPGEPGYTPPAG